MRRILPAGQDALLVETGDLHYALGPYHAIGEAVADAASLGVPSKVFAAMVQSAQDPCSFACRSDHGTA